MTQNLHQTNRRLRFLLETIGTPANTGAAARPAAPEHMNGLLSELMRAGEWVRALPEARDTRLEQEVATYRRQVERLREMLPMIHEALLREKIRLEQERSRLANAAEWAQRSHQTL